MTKKFTGRCACSAVKFEVRYQSHLRRRLSLPKNTQGRLNGSSALYEADECGASATNSCVF